MRAIENMDDYYILCGYGRVGKVVFEELTKRNQNIYYVIDDYTSKLADGVEYGLMGNVVKCDTNQKKEVITGDDGSKMTYCLVTVAPFEDEAGVKEYVEKIVIDEELKKISDVMFDAKAPTFKTFDGKLYVALEKGNKGAEFGHLIYDDMIVKDVTDNSATAVVKEKIYNGEIELTFFLKKIGSEWDSWRISKLACGELVVTEN